MHNSDEDNSPKNLKDNNQQASSQEFRQLFSLLEFIFGVGQNFAGHSLNGTPYVIIRGGGEI